VIIDYLHIQGISALPLKDDAPLIVNSDRVEAGQLSFECFQAISWWRSQVSEFIGIMYI
jgi:hypothetical protein